MTSLQWLNLIRKQKFGEENLMIKQKIYQKNLEYVIFFRNNSKELVF